MGGGARARRRRRQRLAWGSGSASGRTWRRAGARAVHPPAASAAIFIAVGPDEYYAAGTDVSVSFTPNTPGPEHAGIGTVEEGTL